MTSKIVCFTGPVKWVSGPGPAGITLLGRIAEADGTSVPAQLALICLEPLELPSVLNDVTVEALAAPDILLRTGARDWQVRCQTWQLHREVGVMFYTAIPPRPMPWTRRTTWRLLLAVAATAPGRWLLQWLNRSR